VSTLAGTYAEQLDGIASMLVRAGLLTRGEIARHGVQFALRRKLFPKEPPGDEARTYTVKQIVKASEELRREGW
jgi:hypothetical protein